ncbi:RrF2 family transcriptional regulator [Christensenella intestinihominis]|nr:Rrf2 family transcriptional regulator [Christensenella intestinihominis]
MIRIPLRIGYALRILQYMDKQDRRAVNAADLSEIVDVSYLYMMKVLGTLRNANIIESLQGRYGGYRLARDASEMTVFDIVIAVEGEVVLYKRHSGSDDEIVIKEYFDQIEALMISEMQKTTLRDLFNGLAAGKEKPVAI